MKKVISIIFILFFTASLVSCSSVIAQKKEYTFDEFMTAFKGKVTVEQETPKQADLLGAVNGIGFVVGGKSFEIYEFSDKAILQDASDGTYKYTVEGVGEFNMKTAINGKFVLMYNAVDNVVISAFVSIF